MNNNVHLRKQASNEATSPSKRTQDHEYDHDYIGIAAESSKIALWNAICTIYEDDDGNKKTTVEEISKKLKVSKKLIYRWLSGPNNMNIETAGKLAAAMDGYLSISGIHKDELNTIKDTHSFCYYKSVKTNNRNSYVFNIITDNAFSICRAAEPVVIDYKERHIEKA